MKSSRQTLLTVLAATVAGLGAGSAAALEIYNSKGWKLDASGSMNAFYTTSKTDNGGRQSQVENGLLPGFLKFTASTQHNGLDIKGVIGFWPGIASDSPANGSATAGVGKSTSDARTNFLSFGSASLGTVKMGRDVGLFQSNAILGDMTLIGVGGGAGLARNINTTLGGIGAGYVYTEFQPQITYTSPALGPLTVNIGAFDNKDVNATGSTGKKTGIQGLLEVAIPGGKLWAGVVQQDFNLTRDAKALGTELGGKADLGNLGLLASGFSGKGIGDAVLFSGGFDSAGEERKSSGYLVQATYKLGDLKLGVNAGESRTTGTALDGGGDLNRIKGKTVGAYYSLAPGLTLVGELNQRRNDLSKVDTDTLSLGAILFF